MPSLPRFPNFLYTLALRWLAHSETPRPCYVGLQRMWVCRRVGLNAARSAPEFAQAQTPRHYVLRQLAGYSAERIETRWRGAGGFTMLVFYEIVTHD